MHSYYSFHFVSWYLSHTVDSFYLLCLFVLYRHGAENLADLSMHRITHVLNAAQCRRHGGADLYKGMNIAYMGIEARDSCDFDMSTNFQSAADFIHGALSRGGEYAKVDIYALTLFVKCLLNIEK